MLAAPFLNPMIAWGALAAAAPVIIYLVMRQRYKTVVWAAMEFLLAAYRKTRRRRRIEELLLLAIRTLLMLLLPLGLAHPVWNASGASLGREEVHWVMVLDDSYSMGYKGRAESSFQRAKSLAARLVDLMEGKGWVSVFQANAVRSGMIPVEGNRHDVIKEAILDMSVSHAGSNLLGCLADVVKVLKERQTVARHDVFVFTDMQRSGWTRVSTKDPEMVQVLDEIRKRAGQVYVVDVGPPPGESLANIQVQAFTASSRTVTPGRPASFEARVRNLGGARVEEVAVDFFAGAGEERVKRGGEILTGLEKGEERVVTFVSTFDKPGTHPLSVSVGGDGLAADNARHLSAMAREKIKVLLVNGEPGRKGPEGDETFFLEAALALKPDLSPFAVSVGSYMNFETEIDLLKHDVVVLANLPMITARQAELVERFARDGGLVVFTAGAHVARDIEGFNSVLWKDGQGISPARLVEETTVAEPAWLGLSAVPDHAFTRASRLDWEPLREAAFKKAVRMSIPDGSDGQAILRFVPQPAGSLLEAFPALAARPVGLGHVLLFGSALDADWGFDTVFFAQQRYFPTLWYEILFHYTQSAEKRNIGIGEQFEMVFPPEDLSAGIEVKRLDPQAPPAVTVHATAVENRAKLVYPEDPGHAKGEGTDVAGIYQVKRASGPDGERNDYVAVNVDPEEGDLRQRLEGGELPALFPEKFPLVYCASAQELEEKVGGKDHERDLWKPFLIMVFALLCLETVLAWRFGRQ